MKTLRKIIDCESLENSEGKVYDRTYFSKISKLHCTKCNFTINRLYHRFFLKYVVKKYISEVFLQGFGKYVFF